MKIHNIIDDIVIDKRPEKPYYSSDFLHCPFCEVKIYVTEHSIPLSFNCNCGTWSDLLNIGWTLTYKITQPK